MCVCVCVCVRVRNVSQVKKIYVRGPCSFCHLYMLNSETEMVNLPKKFTVGLYFVLEAVVLFFLQELTAIPST